MLLESHALLGREMSLQCRSMLPLNFIFQKNISFIYSYYRMGWFWTPQGHEIEYNLFGRLAGSNIQDSHSGYHPGLPAELTGNI